MTTILIVLIAVIMTINVVLVILFVRRKNGAGGAGETGALPYDPRSDIGLKLILEQVNELNRTVDKKISESTRQMSDNTRNMNDTVHRQFSESQKLIKEITNEL